MQKKTSTHTYQEKWHRFWRDWHEAKAHFYGSRRHERKRSKHEEKLNETIGKTSQQEKQQVQRTSIFQSSSG